MRGTFFALRANPAADMHYPDNEASCALQNWRCHCKARAASVCDSPAAQRGLLVASGLAWMRITSCTVDGCPPFASPIPTHTNGSIKKMLLSSKMHGKCASRMHLPVSFFCSLLDAVGLRLSTRGTADLQTPGVRVSMQMASFHSQVGCPSFPSLL